MASLGCGAKSMFHGISIIDAFDGLSGPFIHSTILGVLNTEKNEAC
jgi:hypothetical protein